MHALIFHSKPSLILPTVMILSIYEVLMLLVLSGVLGLVCGLFSYFLDYTFWPESIFKFYLPWLAKQVLKDEPNIDIMIKLGPDTYIHMAEGKFWYKILGGCAVCFNIWLAMISFTVICALTFIPLWCCFPYIMVSSWLIRKLVKATY